MNEKTKKLMAYRLRSARCTHGKTQEKLAEELHVTAHCCSELENAKSFPSSETLIRFVHLYADNPAELFSALLQVLDEDNETEKTVK